MQDNNPTRPGTNTADSAPRGESLRPIRIVQDVNNFDNIEASNKIQQWQEELRILHHFKNLLLEVMLVALTTGDCGPIPIVSNGLKVLLTKDNLIVLADIIDPVFGQQQLAHCQKRMANSNRLFLPPLIAATGSAVAAASNNKMNSPPKSQKKKRSKPSTSTPPSKTKRKNKEATTPTDKKSLNRIMKKAKKTHSAIKPGREEKNERDARQLVAINCKKDKLEVRNGMWPWTSDMTWDEQKQKIKLIRNQVNHNTVSPSLSNEIANNYLDNIAGADLHGKIYDPSMGGDMKCILTHNTKVNRPPQLCDFFFTFCK